MLECVGRSRLLPCGLMSTNDFDKREVRSAHLDLRRALANRARRLYERLEHARFDFGPGDQYARVYPSHAR